MMRTTCGAILLMLCVGMSGCLIDDTGGTRGQANAPSASVPDSGSPGRRESASETLNNAREPAEKPEGTLNVEGNVNR
jgi:hypothetical protein